MDTPTQNNQTVKPLIMVVDDNPEFLDGIQLILQMEGFEVWTVTSGQQALDELFAVFQAKIKNLNPDRHLPDLILADIMMPEMDGYAFYGHVRNNPYLNHIPFIFLTAKDSLEDIRYGKELGSDDYLPKTSETEDLLAAIRGKLKRIEQRRAIAAQFTWNPDKPLQGRSLILIVAIVSLMSVAFCVGYFFANWGG
ncbi:MAG: response regulator [Anaerolineae bacterium]|nr:response regulator [Anaerolineae bacterium]